MHQMKCMHVSVDHTLLLSFKAPVLITLGEERLLQVVCCLGQLSFISCSACGRFLGLSGLEKTIPHLLTASSEHTSEKLVSAAPTV